MRSPGERKCRRPVISTQPCAKGLSCPACIPPGSCEQSRGVEEPLLRGAFDSRPTADQRDVGRYSRCLLEALRDTVPARGEIVETHRPRQAYDVFHAPWIQGAMLHSPCPMVVTIHELGARTRLSERLRGGGIHLRLRHLAVQRATHVIVRTEALAQETVAELGFERERVVVIPEAPDPVADTASQPSPASPAWA